MELAGQVLAGRRRHPWLVSPSAHGELWLIHPDVDIDRQALPNAKKLSDGFRREISPRPLYVQEWFVTLILGGEILSFPVPACLDARGSPLTCSKL